MKCKKCGKTLDGAIYRGILCERCYEKSIGFLRVGSSGELKNYDGWTRKMKELNEMSLEELFILQRQVGKAIEKRIKVAQSKVKQKG